MTIPDLASVVALSRGEMSLAAKNSEIFRSRQVHDSIFDERVVENAGQVVFLLNLWKACKRAVQNYIRDESNHVSRLKLDRPSARTELWRLGILYGMQRMPVDIRQQYSVKLNKNAPSGLVEHLEKCLYNSAMKRAGLAYRKELKDGDRDVSASRQKQIFAEIAAANKIDVKKGAFGMEKRIRPKKNAA